jgi:hypothetical protein
MHLNDEQFENALEEPGREAEEHLAQCAECRQRLEELRAIQGRLQSAFSAVTAPPALALRIRAAAHEATRPAEHAAGRRMVIFPLRRVGMFLAAAAAILLVAVPLAIVLTSAPSAQAAQEQLVQIHRMNLADGHDFFSHDEPAELAGYFKDKLGFVPAMPVLNQGMAIRGCCVAHFRQKIVGSYVVDTPHGVVSIIVVTDTPSSVGLTRVTRPAGKEMWEGNLGMCNMAAVRMGDYTYTAVSEAPAASLAQLLDLLVP